MAEIMYQRQDFQNSPEQIQSMGAAARAQRARKLYADNLDEKGNLNEAGFYRGIAQSGLGAEDAQTAMAWRGTQSKRNVDQAVDNQRLRDLGSDPMAGGRNAASIGEPEPVYVPNPDYQPPEAAPKRDALSEWWDSIRGRTAEPPAAPAVVDQAAQIQAQTAPPSGGAVAEAETPTDKRAALAQYLGMDLGESRITLGDQSGQMAPLPEGAGASPTTLRPGQDTRSAAQLVEDSYRPESSLAARMEAKMGGSLQGDEQLFQWNPENNGSNQFQQFAGALGAKLKGLGAIDVQGNPDPSQYLRQVYGATLKANMPPAPNEGLMQGTAEDRVKYYGEWNAYAAGVTKAKGQAEQAVLKAKEDLTTYAKQFGVDTVEQRKSEIPGGILLDPAKRTEAAALVTNKQNIANAAHAVQGAVDENGPNVTKLMLAAPQVIRAYATALNPGQQLGEGNLLEVSRVMYPDLSGPKLITIAAALGRGLRNNDWSGFKTVSDAIDATAPQALYQRMQTLTQEAAKLNQISLGSYIQPEAQQAPQPTTTEKLGEALGTGKRTGPKVGDRKTVGGVTGVWDGKTWRRE